MPSYLRMHGMRNILISLIVLGLLGLVSCGDSFESVMQDQAELVDESVQILKDLNNESLTIEEAVGKLSDLEEENRALVGRMEALVKEKGFDAMQEIAEVATSHAEDWQQSLVELQQEFSKLQKSGKLTSELSQAISSIRMR